MSDLTPCGPAHGNAMALVHAASFPAPERWDETAFAAQLGLPGTFGFLAAPGGMVLARVAADEAEILTLAVAAWARRLGLGRRLVSAAHAEATARGAVAIFLEVAEANTAARALYEQCGYVEVGRRHSYYRDGGDALVLRRALQAASDLPSA